MTRAVRILFALAFAALSARAAGACIAVQGDRVTARDLAESVPAFSSLPADTDVEGLTSFLFAIMQGISVQAGSGASREDLERLVGAGLMMWPGA